jgi:hypothetical protein
MNARTWDGEMPAKGGDHPRCVLGPPMAQHHEQEAERCHELCQLLPDAGAGMQ